MDRSNSRPLYLGFASQKGGVGKSTLAEVLASILYYEKDIPLVRSGLRWYAGVIFQAQRA